MTRMPDATAAVVPPAKVTNYLLDTSHPDGRSKADFFMRRGFSPDTWEDLAKALRRHPQDNAVVAEIQTEYGARWRVRCAIRTPDGSNPCIVTIWQLSPGAAAPVPITAYPA